MTVKDLKLNQYSSDSSLLGVFPTLTKKWLLISYKLFNTYNLSVFIMNFLKIISLHLYSNIFIDFIIILSKKS